MQTIITKTNSQPNRILLKISIVFIAIIFITAKIDLSSIADLQLISNLRTLFLSIILESLPFLLLGSLISAFLEIMVSEETIARLIPHQTMLGLLAAAGLGMLFPLCECGIVMIAARLASKKLPLHLFTTFMLAVPLVNPLVILSTRMAFPSGPMVFFRISGAIIVAVLSGWLMKIMLTGHKVLKSVPEDDHCCQCGHCEHHHAETAGAKFLSILNHSLDEFFHMGSYFVMGAFFSSLLQVSISNALISRLGNGPFSSVAVMMLLAFVLSLCSNADAFVANSFSYSFSSGSIAAFLIFGAMLDLKNIFMLFGYFKKRYVLVLAIAVTVLVFAYSMIINLWGGSL